MSGENNFKETVSSLFKGMDAFISAKTVVGDAIHVGDTIILPLVDVSFGLGVEETGQVGLVIRVEQENSLVLGCEAVRQVDRGCGLANPAFQICDRDRFHSKRFLKVIKKDLVVLRVCCISPFR